ncbi:hypothetical protein IWZ00DRAFT_144174 [Phyllosticta capitalensis]
MALLRLTHGTAGSGRLSLHFNFFLLFFPFSASFRLDAIRYPLPVHTRLPLLLRLCYLLIRPAFPFLSFLVHATACLSQVSPARTHARLLLGRWAFTGYGLRFRLHGTLSAQGVTALKACVHAWGAIMNGLGYEFKASRTRVQRHHACGMDMDIDTAGLDWLRPG